MRNKLVGGRRLVLVACRDTAFGATVARFLEADGCETERCHDAAGVLRFLSRKRFDVLVLDLALDEEVDMDLVSFARRGAPETQIILLFDIPKLERALDGIRRGAFFYLPLAVQPTDVALVVGKALQKTANDSTLSEYEQNLFEEMAGGGPAMRRVVEMIVKVSPTDSTVLLLGESGTGKEILANAVHRLSPRRDRPFVAINCAALPENLLESEMFGHVKGAFTGAEMDKQGFFEEADGGSIFLDEVGDMAPSIQAKLLRVLQSGEVRAVGSNTSRRVDVRVIAATNQDLVEAVREHKFREDLYFRLAVIQIRIPALRDRADALPNLISHFLRRFNARFAKSVQRVDDSAITLLRQYPYPGNVRELENIIAHAVILCDGDTIRAEDLPETVRQGVPTRLALPERLSERTPTLLEMEERLIRATLEAVKGNQTEAAKRLGISRSTLWRKVREYGITASEDGGDD